MQTNISGTLFVDLICLKPDQGVNLMNLYRSHAKEIIGIIGIMRKSINIKHVHEHTL